MRIVFNILLLLLSATAVLSCSDGLMQKEELPPYTEPGMDDFDYKIVVTGTASDFDTNPPMPLEEIKIILKACEQRSENYTIRTDKTAYTDNNGKFAVSMSGFKGPTSFTVNAEDPHGIYQGATHEISTITWENNYNVTDGVFYVNGCDLYLKKKN